MNRRILGVLIGILAALTLSTAQAGDDAYTPGTTHLSLEGGFAVGGDKLATVFGTDGSTHKIYAGNSLYGDVGLQYNIPGSPLSLRTTAGLSYTGVTASNGTISFTYLPVNVLLLYNNGYNHFGGGFTYHVSPHLDMDGFGPDADFQSAPGLILQYQYWLFGVRYTNVRYKISSLSGSNTCIANCSFDGSSIGVFFNYVF